MHSRSGKNNKVSEWCREGITAVISAVSPLFQGAAHSACQRDNEGQLGRAGKTYLNITPSTVRADLNRFSGVGQQGYGYNVKLLYTGISRELGAGDNMSAVIIGGDAAFAKRLAERFEGRGVTVTCFFPDIGEGDGKTGSCAVTEISRYLSEAPADIAVIVSLPEADECRYACFPRDKGNVWNMTQNDIIAPVPVINLPVGDIIMNLCYEIRRKGGGST